jgi:hypothetical protein
LPKLKISKELDGSNLCIITPKNSTEKLENIQNLVVDLDTKNIGGTKELKAILDKISAK